MRLIQTFDKSKPEADDNRFLPAKGVSPFFIYLYFFCFQIHSRMYFNGAAHLPQWTSSTNFTSHTSMYSICMWDPFIDGNFTPHMSTIFCIQNIQWSIFIFSNVHCSTLTVGNSRNEIPRSAHLNTHFTSVESSLVWGLTAIKAKMRTSRWGCISKMSSNLQSKRIRFHKMCMYVCTVHVYFAQRWYRPSEIASDKDAFNLHKTPKYYLSYQNFCNIRNKWGFKIATIWAKICIGALFAQLIETILM